MRKFPMILTVLAVAAVVMATAAFTHPLAVRNGVVTSFSPGASMTIRGEHYEQSYSLRGMGNSTTSSGTTGTNPIAGLGVGAHVTVFAECFGGGNSSSNNGVSASTASKAAAAASTNGNTTVASGNASGNNSTAIGTPAAGGNGTNFPNGRGGNAHNNNGRNSDNNATRDVANSNPCVALFVVVRSAAPNASSATGTVTTGTGTAGAGTGTAAPGTGTGTAAPGTGTGTAMPGGLPAVTPTATP